MESDATTAEAIHTEPDDVPEDHAAEQEGAMVRAVIKGISIMLPLGLVAVFVMLLAIGQPWNRALAAAWLPGVLIGVFFGGFAGVARTMD